MYPLAEVIEILERISQDRKVEIVIHITSHGNFIEITLGTGFQRTYDYDLEVKMTKELGLDPGDNEFINNLVNQTTDQVTDHCSPDQ